jgi:hypothetical protein
VNSGKLTLKMRQLTPAERNELGRRERKYRSKLARQGYMTRALVDESGCFGVVLVEDPESQRRGLLLPDGKVHWMDQAMGPGALAHATVSGVTIDDTPR